MSTLMNCQIDETLDLDEAARVICQQRGLEFQGLLGRGAFKSAYLAVGNNTPIALKLALVEGASVRLLREATALRDCRHQCIAQIFDTFECTHGSYVLWGVLEEYLGGGTLEQRISSSGLLAPEVVRELGISLAHVLEHLHERRLVHRDIKPANILFRDSSHAPVLTDFGVVRMLDQPSLTRDFLGMGPGTPAYAAPEQLNNEKAQIDWRTDQFGLAVVLSECLIGRHPFALPGQGRLEAISAVASKRPLPPHSAEELIAHGFPGLVPALNPWPVARHRRPVDLIAALADV